MNGLTRRGVLTAGMAAAMLPPLSARAYSRSEIDRYVAEAVEMLRATVPGANDLMERAQGYLVMAKVQKAGLNVGGEYGEGTLFVGGAPVEYYSVAAASFGLQVGVQRSNQALFFMTEPSLKQFRQADGWTAGADAEVAVQQQGGGLGASTVTANQPVIAVIFGREGLMASASLEGAKYSRIYR